VIEVQGGYLLWKTGGSFLIVLTLLIIVAYGLKRWGMPGSRSTEGDWIRVLARETLGPKHYLVLVQIQKSLLLLGVSPEGINLLSSLERDASSAGVETPSATSPQSQKLVETILERLPKNPFSRMRREC
jgi:flagellar biosynthetic protein FliO